MRLLPDLPIIAATAIAVALSPAAARGLWISGAATVARSIILPNRTAIERETGLTLTVIANGDGDGVKDLYAGRADVAMIAAPLRVTEETLSRVVPGFAGAADFRLVPIGTMPIRFLVNPANPVRSLSATQVRDIFTGRITSWKAVGGPDQAIVVVAEAPGLGTRATVETDLLGGEAMSATARTMPTLIEVVQIVAQIPNAIGYGNSASITPDVTVISDVTVEQPLGLATRGPPSAVARKLESVVMKYGGKVK